MICSITLWFSYNQYTLSARLFCSPSINIITNTTNDDVAFGIRKRQHKTIVDYDLLIVWLALFLFICCCCRWLCSLSFLLSLFHIVTPTLFHTYSCKSYYTHIYICFYCDFCCCQSNYVVKKNRLWLKRGGCKNAMMVKTSACISECGSTHTMSGSSVIKSPNVCVLWTQNKHTHTKQNKTKSKKE